MNYLKRLFKSRDQLKYSFLLRFILDALGRVSMIILTIILARQFPVDVFGQWVFALSFTGLCYFFTEMGTQLIFLRELGRVIPQPGTPEAGTECLQKSRELWGEFFGLKILLSIIVAFVGTGISFFIWPWGKPFVAIAMLGWMIGNSFVDFFNQACNAANQLLASAFAMLVHRGLCFASVIVVLLTWKDLRIVSFSFCVSSLVGAFLGFVIIGKKLDFIDWPTWQPKIWKHWLKISWPLGISALFALAYSKVGIFMLPWMKNDLETGFFGAAQKIYELGFMVPAALMAIALPRLSYRFATDQKLFWKDAFRMGQFLFALAVVWILGMGIPTVSVIHILFGQNYEPSVIMVRIILLANGLMFINYLLNHLFVVIHRERFLVIFYSLGLSINVVLNLFFIPKAGGVGAAWTLVATEIFLLILASFTLRSLYARTTIL